MTKAVWITGLPGSGKSTIARELKKKLKDFEILRLDEIRKKYVKEPKYTDKERDFVYKEYAEDGLRLLEKGKNVIFDATAHKKKYREDVRRRTKDFVEAYIKCSLKVCIERESDRKQGLVMANIYKKAVERKKTGQKIKGLGKVIGVDVAYEENKKAEIVIESNEMTPKEAAEKIKKYLDKI